MGRASQGSYRGLWASAGSPPCRGPGAAPRGRAGTVLTPQGQAGSLSRVAPGKDGLNKLTSGPEA